MNDTQAERLIVGELVLSLTEQGFRVELCDQDGGGLFLYAVPDGGFKPDNGYEYWVLLVPGNGTSVISDYSVNLQSALVAVNKLADTLDDLAD